MFSWIGDVHFHCARAFDMFRRGMASLRTRGLRPTLQRIAMQLHLPSPRAAQPLFAADQSPFEPFAVPRAERPRASIVVPAYNQSRRTLACLRAIAAHPPGAAIEVIVADDGSQDDTAAMLARIDGVRHLRLDGNRGFIAACNAAAAEATGDHLVFLNNDTVPQPGWLDALLETFRTHPGAGLVGAQLLYPNGRLQEAGGLVHSDGSCQNFGRFDDPAHPAYGYVREVDYASGAAIAIPRALFAETGGFDPRYSPAYYEDVDLAFAVRDAGWKVLYQPASRVVHDEGGTSGTDPGAGAKAHQVRNRDVFARHRARELRSQPPPGTPPADAVFHRNPKRVLVVDERLPTPDRDSGSLRLVNLMKLLVEEGAHVAFLPTADAGTPASLERLRSIGVETWHPPFTGSVPAWLRRHAARFDVVMASRYQLARAIIPAVRAAAPRARMVLDCVDLHHLREARAAETTGDAALARNAARTRTLELDAIARSDVGLVVSESERAILAAELPASRIAVVSNLHDVAGAGRPYEQRRDLVFVGGFRHPPNADAIRWFGRDVYPLLRQSLPDIRFHCIGDHPPDDIKALEGMPGFLVHGHVADITDYLEGCRIGIAPLRYGAGVKGKVNQSMAHGQPVVATSMAAEGMHLVDGRDALIADGAEAFAAAIVRLHGDKALWESLASHGLENVRRHFSKDAMRAAVREVFFD